MNLGAVAARRIQVRPVVGTLLRSNLVNRVTAHMCCNDKMHTFSQRSAAAPRLASF